MLEMSDECLEKKKIELTVKEFQNGKGFQNGEWAGCSFTQEKLSEKRN